MMEQEFENILDAVSESFGISKSEILKKYAQKTTKARYFLYHVVQHGMPYLRHTVLEQSNITRNALYKGADWADESIHKSTDDLHLMNGIRAKIGLPPLKRAVTHKDKISNTKTLFGFDYTESDILRRCAMIKKSNDYMREVCSIGRNPTTNGIGFIPSKARNIQTI